MGYENYDDEDTRWVMGVPFKVRASAAAEPKFKAGDRVRVVKDGYEYGGSSHSASIGSVGNITNVGEDGYFQRDDGWYFKPHEIELARRFQPNQPVRLARHYGGYACGDTGKVSEYCRAGVLVTMDAPPSWLAIFPEDALATDCAEHKEQPKFKTGDRVTTSGVNDAGIGEVIGYEGDGSVSVNFRAKYGICCEPEGWLTLVPTAQPCIVALTKNGQPRPADRPYVHANADTALAEAERLAKNNPGQEFAVYQRVGARVAEAKVEYSMKEIA